MVKCLSENHSTSLFDKDFLIKQKQNEAWEMIVNFIHQFFKPFITV
jgi:hypothetical protein